MAATFSLAVEVRASVGGRVIGIGDLNVPYSYTSSSDVIFSSRELVPTSTATTLIANITGEGDPSSPTFLMLIPSVDGNFGIHSSSAADNSTMLAWKAGFPLILSTGKTSDYNADASDRASTATGFITTIYFYHESGSNAYVEVMSIK